MKSAPGRRWRCVAALVATLCPVVAAAVDYAGIGPNTDPMTLRELFPASRHEFWQRGTGSVVVPGDDTARFEALLKEGDGRYVVRLAADDTRAEVTSIGISIEAGKVRLVTLGFERDGEGNQPVQVERRYPACRAVLDALVEKFGSQPTLTTRVEEYLEHRTRTWSGPEGSMRLDCGRFVNRRPIFAIDLEFDLVPAPAATGSNAAPVAPPVAVPKPASKPVSKPAPNPKAATVPPTAKPPVKAPAKPPAKAPSTKP